MISINEFAISIKEPETVSRFLGNFSYKTTQMFREINFKVFKKLLHKSKLTSITIDIDSSVINVEGHQEGAAKGYNPKKLGSLLLEHLILLPQHNQHCLYRQRSMFPIFSRKRRASRQIHRFSILPKCRFPNYLLSRLFILFGTCQIGFLTNQRIQQY